MSAGSGLTARKWSRELKAEVLRQMAYVSTGGNDRAHMMSQVLALEGKVTLARLIPPEPEIISTSPTTYVNYCRVRIALITCYTVIESRAATMSEQVKEIMPRMFEGYLTKQEQLDSKQFVLPSPAGAIKCLAYSSSCSACMSSLSEEKFCR